MRVIGGLASGLRLKAPKGNKTRPTTDRVRENIFNVCAPRIPGARVLDLFAGTGAMGIEALSRGAEVAVFVDSEAEPVSCITYNLEVTSLSDRGRPIRSLVKSALVRLATEGWQFDLVFLDPPYGRGLIPKTLIELADLGLLAPQGLVAAEHGRRENLSSEVEAGGNVLRLFRRLDYGDTAISLFRLLNGTEEA